MADAATALATLDWRRRTHDLYRRVRACPDPAEGHELWRQGRDALFATHPASPLLPAHREGFTGLAVAAYDPAYRFEVEVDGDVPAERLEVPTGTDGVVPFERVGRVHLPTPGGPVDLDVWRLTSYGGGLFVPVKDGLAGRETYGGGRYVLDTVKGADLGGDVLTGRVVVDLNFAYNPSCAYDPEWACPLAPAGNTTGVPLPGGAQHAGPGTELA